MLELEKVAALKQIISEQRIDRFFDIVEIRCGSDPTRAYTIKNWFYYATMAMQSFKEKLEKALNRNFRLELCGYRTNPVGSFLFSYIITDLTNFSYVRLEATWDPKDNLSETEIIDDIVKYYFWDCTPSKVSDTTTNNLKRTYKLALDYFTNN